MAEYDICTYIGKLTGRETENKRERDSIRGMKFVIIKI